VAAARTLGFKPVPASGADRVTVPEGYTATPLAPWGEAVGIAGQMPAFKLDASNSAAEQAVQMGMHHDGLQFYALDGSRRGLLAINQEYTDDGLLHVGGQSLLERREGAQGAGRARHHRDRDRTARPSSGRWCGPAATRGASPPTRPLPWAARRPAMC
jgi:secreted PhoX family phosphatase